MLSLTNICQVLSRLQLSLDESTLTTHLMQLNSQSSSPLPPTADAVSLSLGYLKRLILPESQIHEFSHMVHNGF
jgi:hypothetical protein